MGVKLGRAHLPSILQYVVYNIRKCWNYTILYYTILYYTILYYTILYCTVLYYTTVLSVCSNSVFFLLIFLHNSRHLVSPVCILSCSSVYLLLLRIPLNWQYSQMRTFASLIDFSQSALLFHFAIVHFLISLRKQFHHLLFARTLSRLPWRLNTWLTFLLLSVLLTWPIQFNRLILTNENMSKELH